MTNEIRSGFIKSSSGHRLSYDIMEGKEPYILFLHGTASGKNPLHNGQLTNAGNMQMLASKLGVGYIAIDMNSHGKSEGVYEKDFNMTSATNDVISAIKVFDKNVVAVASSMGAWPLIKSLDAVGDKVKGMVTLSGAPDHQEEVDFVINNPQMRAALGVKEIDCDGTLASPALPVVYTMKYLEDCDKNSVLRGPINYNGPVAIIHGEKDQMVSPTKAPRIAKALTSDNVSLYMLPESGHSMHSPAERNLINAVITNMISPMVSKDDLLKATVALNIVNTRA